MLLILDNYDSFTYNLVHYLEELGAATKGRTQRRIDGRRSGGTRARARRYLARSRWPRASWNFVCARRAVGWCDSHFGRLSRAPSYRPSLRRARRAGQRNRPRSGDASATRWPDAVCRVANPFVATRYHSLTVERASLPECLEISATSEDGMIMGIRHRRWPLEGVQFHPESILTIEGKQLLANFLRL